MLTAGSIDLEDTFVVTVEILTVFHLSLTFEIN